MRTSISIAAAILMSSTLPHAAAASDHDQARALSRSGAIVPLEQVTAQARRRNVQEILEVELEAEDGGYVYEVEVVDGAGTVRKLLYDAVTGEPLGKATDDE